MELQERRSTTKERAEDRVVHRQGRPALSRSAARTERIPQEAKRTREVFGGTAAQKSRKILVGKMNELSLQIYSLYIANHPVK